MSINLYILHDDNIHDLEKDIYLIHDEFVDKEIFERCLSKIYTEWMPADTSLKNIAHELVVHLGFSIIQPNNRFLKIVKNENWIYDRDLLEDENLSNEEYDEKYHDALVKIFNGR